MTVSGMIWFLVGGVIGCMLGGIMAFNVAFAREYSDKVDYYDLDDVEINTPTYEYMLEYDKYDEF